MCAYCSRIPDVDALLDVCLSLHTVYPAAEEFPVAKCEGNPLNYTCQGCKSFQGAGICSHVLAVNHILKKFNVRYQLKHLKDTKEKKGGNVKKVEPALQKLKERQPDSSDEEDEEMLRLGAQGL